MPLRAIAYVSELVPTRMKGLLDEVVEDAARFNRLAGVTGVLLHDGTRFLQYLEGPPDGLDLAYDRIMQSKSHAGVTELARGSVATRQFPYWAMRWLPVNAECVWALSQGDWEGFRRSACGAGKEGTAIELLDAVVQPLVHAT